MFLGRSHTLTPSPCTNCGHVMELASVVDFKDSRRPPRPGDVTVCIRCGHLMGFTADRRLREPTGDEMIRWAGDHRLLVLQEARGTVMRMRGADLAKPPWEPPKAKERAR